MTNRQMFPHSSTIKRRKRSTEMIDDERIAKFLRRAACRRIRPTKRHPWCLNKTVTSPCQTSSSIMSVTAFMKYRELQRCSNSSLAPWNSYKYIYIRCSVTIMSSKSPAQDLVSRLQNARQASFRRRTGPSGWGRIVGQAEAYNCTMNVAF